MQARETTFQQLVQGEKQFQVPLYQRTYSWKERQLEQLWSDILDQADAHQSDARKATHFLGSVVLAPSPLTSVSGLQRWLVVDGQQRLTTLMVALCALRDHQVPEDPTARERFDDRYLINKYLTGNERYRLLPTQADRASFVACVSAAPDADAGDGIPAAYRWFRKAAAAADDPEDLEDIARIEGVIRDRLALVEIVADRDDNVHRIFESLNNTGLGLTQADLLRNYIFMLLPNRGDELYEAVWLPLQERLTSEELETLLYLDLVLRGHETVRRDELYRVQQERLEPLRADEAAIESELRALDRRARYLERLIHPEAEPNPRLRRVIHFLKQWAATTTYPVLLRLLELKDEGLSDQEDIIEAAEILEGYMVRRMLAGVATQGLNRSLATTAQELSGSENVAEQLRRILSAPRRRWPSDSDVRESVRRRPFYWSGRAVQRTLVLRRLEETFESGEPVDYSTAKLSIEHVLPQTPTPEWLDVLSEELVEESGPEELHGLLVHTLGNLTLTAYNSSLSNLPFTVKREKLGQSAFFMNQWIASKQRWGRAEIEARAEDLAARALSVWPGPLPGFEVQATKSSWQMLRQALASLPGGSWTTYGDLAELIGSHPVPVGSYLAKHRIVNAHRVLTRDGRISPMFRWLDEEDHRDPAAVLASEGVEFTEGGAASSSQRMSASDLASLVGVSTEELLPAPSIEEIGQAERHAQFIAQLREAQSPEAAGAVEQLVHGWRKLSGTLEFGSSAATTCFLMLRKPTAIDTTRRWWPLAIYPSGPVEVQFQYLRDRPPWDMEELRQEFRARLNAAPGIEIAEAKLTVRPGFDSKLLQDDEALEAVMSALEWFVLTTEREVVEDPVTV